MATEHTLDASSLPHVNKNPEYRRDLELFIVLMRYMVFGLVLAYWHYHANLPQLVRILSRSPADSLETFYNNKDSPIFKPENWNDEAFMAAYQCNANHTYKVQITNKDPLIMYLTGFLSSGEAEHLKSLAHPMMKRSTVTGKEENALHEGRTSSNAFLLRQQDKVVQCIENRAGHFSRKPIENMEGLQVVYYGKGQEYRPHFDYFEPGRDGTERELKRGGQREITIFVYLNSLNESEGGGTIFPKLKLGIKPEKNDALFWYDMNAEQEVDPRTFHAGAPVHADDCEKWGLNIWIREQEFN